MTASPRLPTSTEGVRTRTVTLDRSRHARAFDLRSLDGLRTSAARSQRGDAAPPPAVALLGLELDEVERGRTVFTIVADELHENPMGTMHGGIVATLVDTAMGCAVSSTLARRRRLHHARAEDQLRPRDHAGDRTHARRRQRRASRRSRRDDRSARLRRRAARCTRTPPRRA